MRPGINRRPRLRDGQSIDGQARAIRGCLALREETYLYATPEIQAEREEYAPKAEQREAIGHIGEAAERDRAQTAAHDEALRSELRELPTAEIAARHGELGTSARKEANDEVQYAPQLQAVEERWAQLEAAAARREAVEDLGFRTRRQEPFAIESQSEIFGLVRS